MLERTGLRFALFGKGFDELSDEPGQIALCVGGVLAPDDVIRDEERLAQTKTLAPKAMPIGKLLSWLFLRPTVSV